MASRSWLNLQGDTILDEIPCGIMVLDRDLRIVRHNKAFADVFGESEGRFCYQVYKDREVPCPECVAKKTFDDGRQRIMELKPRDLHQRVPVILGSREEVARVVSYHSE